MSDAAPKTLSVYKTKPFSRFARKAHISDEELEAFRELADVVLSYTGAEMAKRVADGALIPIVEPMEDQDGR